MVTGYNEESHELPFRTMLTTNKLTEWLEEEISYQKTGFELSCCPLTYLVFSFKKEIMLAILLKINMSHVLGFINYNPVMRKLVEIH